MSQYNKSPFKPTPRLLVAGTPEYVFGSYNDRVGPTLGNVISDSAATTTATVVFQIVSGNAPVAGSLITIVGTANSAKIFNVTNAAIATVSTTDAGVCTVTFTIASTTQATTADGGQVIVPQPEVGEALTVAGYASVPVACPFNNAEMENGKSITTSVTLPAGNITSATVVLQGANIDLDSEYQVIGRGHRSAVWRPGGRLGRSGVGVHARLPRGQRLRTLFARRRIASTCCTAWAVSPRRSRSRAQAEARSAGMGAPPAITTGIGNNAAGALLASGRWAEADQAAGRAGRRVDPELHALPPAAATRAGGRPG